MPESSPKSLVVARRSIDELDGVQMLADADWFVPWRKWSLKCRLSPDVKPKGQIPPESDWWVLIDDSYPWGSIDFYPDKDRGIRQTFPHQKHNAPLKDHEWRTGKLCLDSSVRVLGRAGDPEEPIGNVERLAWHFRRALLWLEKGSRDELLPPGDPFELPEFPVRNDIAIGFTEDRESFATWNEMSAAAGPAKVASVKENPDLILIQKFLSTPGDCPPKQAWGDVANTNVGEVFDAVWLRLQGVPVLRPWQAPATWGELAQACGELGFGLWAELRPFLKTLRDGRRHFLLAGFPVPEKVGGPCVQFQWQGALLPPLTATGGKRSKSDKGKEVRYWLEDRRTAFGDRAKVEWLRSENLHRSEVSARGQLSEPLRSMAVAILGVGAVGCVIAELLARAGCRELVLMDSDRFSGGNAVRHLLGSESVGKPKVLAVAERLRLACPALTVRAINQSFPTRDDEATSVLQECDVIIDCTADDEAPHFLEAFEWNRPKRFLSVWLGFGADRLYVFSAQGDRFPYATYMEKSRPWLKEEGQRVSKADLPREGIGCWHPVFPARIDDVWMLSATAVREIEQSVQATADESRLSVFGREIGAGGSLERVTRRDV